MNNLKKKGIEYLHTYFILVQSSTFDDLRPFPRIPFRDFQLTTNLTPALKSPYNTALLTRDTPPLCRSLNHNQEGYLTLVQGFDKENEQDETLF